MKKKDFELIASILKKGVDEAKGTINQELTAEGIVFDFANILAEKYPLFQKDKFLKACGVEQ